MDFNRIKKLDEISDEHIKKIQTTVGLKYQEELEAEITKLVQRYISELAQTLQESGMLTKTTLSYIESNEGVLVSNVMKNIQSHGSNIAEAVTYTIQSETARTIETAQDKDLEDKDKADTISNNQDRKKAQFENDEQYLSNEDSRTTDYRIRDVLTEFRDDSLSNARRSLDNNGYLPKVIDERNYQAKNMSNRKIDDTLETIYQTLDENTRKSFEYIMSQTEEYDTMVLQELGLDDKSLEEADSSSNHSLKSEEISIDDSQELSPEKDEDPKPIPPTYVDFFNASQEESDKYMKDLNEYNKKMQEWKKRHPDPPKPKKDPNQLDIDLII